MSARHADTPPAREVMRRRTIEPGAVLRVACFGAALAFLDATIVNVAFPDIRASFPDASLSGISWVLNAYNIVFAAFLLPAGRIADLLGRKRLFEWGIWLFVVASVLCAAAPTVELLIAARAVQALGAAVLVPASLALVLQAFPGPRRTHGVAMWSAMAALAAGLGPGLGGILVELEGWRLVFLVNVPLGALALLLARRTLVESRAPGKRTVPDLIGATELAVATALFTLGVVQGDTWGWDSPATWGCMAAGIALGAVFLARCRWHRAPMVDLALLRIRSVSVMNLLTLIGAAGFYSYVLCNVLFLTSVWGYSVLEAGLAITPGPFIAAAVARPASAVAARVGARWVIAVGAVIWAAGVYWLITRIGLTPDFVGEWLPVMFILGVGAGICFPVVGGAAVAEIPGGRFATGTGLNSVARQLGAVLGIALLVAIVGRPEPSEVAGAFDRGWTFALGCFALVALIAPFAGRIVPAQDDDEAPEPAILTAPIVVPRRLAAGAGEAAAAPAPRRTVPEILAAVPLFAGLPAGAADALAERVRSTDLPAGEYLFHEGDPVGSVYIVAAGRLEVVAGDEVLRVLGPGDVVGELALLAESPRSASVRGRRDSRVLEIRRKDFNALLAEEPDFARALLRETGAQLQASRALAAPDPDPGGTIAVIALDARAPLDDVVASLLDELAAGGPATVMGPADRDDDAARAELLERLERDHDHVVLAGRDGDPWAAFAARQADRIVVVAGDADPPSGAADRAELRGADLVVVSPRLGAATPWLDALSPRALHLVRPATADRDRARAARRIAGRSVGIVFSGGGARAFAHIGVLDEFAAAGIEVDRVGGCSMGALIAAMSALGMEPDEIDARCYEEWVRRRPLTDYRIPRHSLIKGERIRAMLHRNLPGLIEDLERDFFCVSGDLVSGDLVVHRRGELYAAVGASMSLPGLVAPVALDGRLLVDGGVLNNLPVDVMAERSEGPVIAVDVTHQRFRNGAEEGSLTGFGETLTRALLLGSADVDALARTHAELVIVPPDDGVGMLEFHQLDRARLAGRRATVRALEADSSWLPR
ncbi:MAG TPA: MFS transporter [Solirubrobacteraceae bacterium]|nr:MFS transporter [Solirubrobacteraceae bacterium]